MKQLVYCALSLVLALSLCACGIGDSSGTGGLPFTTPTSDTAAEAATTASEIITAPTEAAKREYPDNIMAHYRLNNDEGHTVVYGSDSLRRSEITEITFLDTLEDMPATAWDVSEAQDGRVMAWNEGSHLYIAGEGGVTLPENCNCLFSDFENVTRINFNDCLYTDLVVDWNGFFNYCVSLESLDLSFFNTDNAEKMANLFNHCESLTSLDISNFNTRKVRSMSQMFCGCRSLESLTFFTTPSISVRSCAEMFSGCSRLDQLDLSAMDTGNVTDFCAMFRNCSSLTVLDLSAFDFSMAERTIYMFQNCTALTDINCTIVVPDTCDAENMYDGSGLNG